MIKLKEKSGPVLSWINRKRFFFQTEQWKFDVYQIKNNLKGRYDFFSSVISIENILTVDMNMQMS